MTGRVNRAHLWPKIKNGYYLLLAIIGAPVNEYSSERICCAIADVVGRERSPTRLLLWPAVMEMRKDSSAQSLLAYLRPVGPDQDPVNGRHVMSEIIECSSPSSLYDTRPLQALAFSGLFKGKSLLDAHTSMGFHLAPSSHLSIYMQTSIGTDIKHACTLAQTDTEGIHCRIAVAQSFKARSVGP